MAWEAQDKRDLELPKDQALEEEGAQNSWGEGNCLQGPLLTAQGGEQQPEPGKVPPGVLFLVLTTRLECWLGERGGRRTPSHLPGPFGWPGDL